MSANIKTLNCPHCGAPLEYSGNAPTMRCPFCDTVVIIPADIRGSAAPVPDKQEPPEMAEVRRLLQAGKKLEAIKVYRSIYPVGLAEAKYAVERMQTGAPVEPGPSADRAPATPDETQELVEIKRLLQAGNKIAAIREYRRIYPVGLKEAKDAVESMESGLPLASRPSPQASARRFDPKKWGPLATLFAVTLFALLAAVIFQMAFTSSSGLSFAPSPTPRATYTAQPSATPSATPTPGFARAALSFGGPGIGAGLLSNARQLAVDAKGNIYVADGEGGRVQVFDSSGQYKAQWSVGDSKTQIEDIQVDREGTAYIIANEQIRRYKAGTGETLGVITYPPGDRFGKLALTPDGGLIAMWYQARWGIITSLQGHREDIVLFDRAGKVMNVWPSPISGQTDTAEIETRLAVDGRGNVLALGGTFEQAVFEFSPEGKFVTRLITSGQGPGRLDGPGTITLDRRERIYIGDSKGIKVFDRNGLFLGTIPDIHSPESLAIGPNDEIWVLDSDKVTQFILN